MMKNKVLILITLQVLLEQFAFGQSKVQKFDSLLTNLHNTENLNGNVLVAEKGKLSYNDKISKYLPELRH